MDEGESRRRTFFPPAEARLRRACLASPPTTLLVSRTTYSEMDSRREPNLHMFGSRRSGPRQRPSNLRNTRNLRRSTDTRQPASIRPSKVDSLQRSAALPPLAVAVDPSQAPPRFSSPFAIARRFEYDSSSSEPAQRDAPSRLRHRREDPTQCRAHNWRLPNMGPCHVGTGIYGNTVREGQLAE
jgi:hypothetical protein